MKKKKEEYTAEDAEGRGADAEEEYWVGMKRPE
jgi:hypothetical protein